MTNNPFTYTFNVGLYTNDGGRITVPEVLYAFKLVGFSVIEHGYMVKESGTEPTLVFNACRLLTGGDHTDAVRLLSVYLKQDCIAYRYRGTGYLIGPDADAWGGEFNPEYFIEYCQ